MAPLGPAATYPSMTQKTVWKIRRGQIVASTMPGGFAERYCKKPNRMICRDR